MLSHLVRGSFAAFLFVDIKVLEGTVCLSSQTAGLRLIGRHAAQFSSCLMEHHRALFETMCRLCGHINGEMKKTSYYALEAFLKQVEIFPDLLICKCDLFLKTLFGSLFQVAILVAENIEEHKNKLKFFMQKFCGIIKTMESTHKELSIAIRGYGFFAGVRFCAFSHVFYAFSSKFSSSFLEDTHFFLL